MRRTFGVRCPYYGVPTFMRIAPIYRCKMSKHDLPPAEDGADAGQGSEDDERHPLEVGLDAAAERDTAGIEDILEDIE